MTFINPEMHMYDCPGTLPGGRGCETCKDWEGRPFADIRRELAATPSDAPIVSAPRSTPEPARPSHHAEHCERLVTEGGICTCHSEDDYDREPANMADLEDGINAGW
ncbi:hypothetical protein [Streptomyces sp. NPDC005548]|uniref:hypothetical protein n=1 Tax=Streptomyces sp. NPDC005548 TaxID=3364724 RepID=UPI0036A6DA5D